MTICCAGRSTLPASPRMAIRKRARCSRKPSSLTPSMRWHMRLWVENYYVGWVNLFNPEPNGLEQALNMEQQALALDDSLSRAHSVLAAVYVQKEQYDEALTEARRGIALDPNSADGYQWLAEVLNIQGKSAAALGAVEKAMRLDPRSLDNYAVEQGFAYTQLGQWQESISALKPHLVRYPEYLWTLVFLTDDYSGLGDAAAARAYAAEVERIVARGPESAIGYVALAEVLNATARPSEALAAIDRGMRSAPARNPPSDKYLVEQGWAYSQLGRWQEGIRATETFLGLVIPIIFGPTFFWLLTILNWALMMPRGQRWQKF